MRLGMCCMFQACCSDCARRAIQCGQARGLGVGKGAGGREYGWGAGAQDGGFNLRMSTMGFTPGALAVLWLSQCNTGGSILMATNLGDSFQAFLFHN